MKNKAKKICAGQWEFMNWEINQMFDDNDRPSHWNMKPIGEDFWTDSANTLGDAKLMIERFTNINGDTK